MYVERSVTRLGDFFKLSVAKLLAIVAQIFGDFWGYFEKIIFK